MIRKSYFELEKLSFPTYKYFPFSYGIIRISKLETSNYIVSIKRLNYKLKWRSPIKKMKMGSETVTVSQSYITNHYFSVYKKKIYFKDKRDI